MEYISLHEYTKNTPSDIEVSAEHQLRVDRSTWPAENNIKTHTKLGRVKKLAGKTGVLVGLDLPWGGGELKQGSEPHTGAIIWVREVAERETADLWQPQWDENQTVLATAIHTLDGAVAGSWNLGIVEQCQGKGCCWLQRDSSRRCEGGDCGGKCLWREAGQPWKPGDSAESHVASGAITIASLCPLQAMMGSWTIERLAHQKPDALDCRVGPRPGCPFQCLTSRSTE